MTGIPLKGTAKFTTRYVYDRAVSRGAKNPVFEPQFLWNYLNSLELDCARVGLNADVLAAQWAVETGDGTSSKWINDGNPAGIGVPSKGPAAGYKFSSGQAARCHVVHMCAYAGIDVPQTWKDEDPKWKDVIDAGWFGTVTTTADLGNGKWAEDPEYNDAITERYAAYFGAYVGSRAATTVVSAGLNFDPALVPFPPYEFKLALDKVDGIGQDDLGKREYRGTVFHRGLTGGQTLDGAVAYLIDPDTRGLTDGYIDNQTGRVVMMNPMVSLFPDVLQKIPKWKDRSGWASGPVGGPDHDTSVSSARARAWLKARAGSLGFDAVNQNCESFEILGDYDTPISNKCKRVIAQIAASRAQMRRIPYTSWPVNPADGVEEVFGHRDWCGTDYKVCPGSVVWSFMNGEMIEMVRNILRQAQQDGRRMAVDNVLTIQSTTVPVQTASPVTNRPQYAAQSIPGWLRELTAGVRSYAMLPTGEIWFANRSKWKAIRRTDRLQTAVNGGPRVGAPVEVGEVFRSAATGTNNKGEAWIATEAGTRIDMDDVQLIRE